MGVLLVVISLREMETRAEALKQLLFARSGGWMNRVRCDPHCPLAEREDYVFGGEGDGVLEVRRAQCSPAAWPPAAAMRECGALGDAVLAHHLIHRPGQARWGLAESIIRDRWAAIVDISILNGAQLVKRCASKMAKVFARAAFG